METAQTADYALRVLDALYAKDGQTIPMLADRLGLGSTVTRRVVVTLHGRAFVMKRTGGTYWLGPELLRVAQSMPNPLSAVAEPHVRALSLETGETVVLSVARRDDAVVLAAHLGSTGQLRVEYEVGYTHPLVRSASGLAILAFLPDDEREAIAGRDLLPRLDAIRASGHAVTVGQLREHMIGWGVPVMSAGRVLGSLAIVVPVSRGDDHPDAVARLEATARAIEQQILTGPAVPRFSR